MTDLVTTLPGGVLDEAGTRHRDAVIRALTGEEEQMLAAGAAPAAVLVTRLLARCTDRVGPIAATEQVVRDLAVGDRQALLLGLRQATFGPRVAAVVVCPWRDCAGRMDIDFAIPDIPVTEATDLPVEYSIELTSSDAGACADAGRGVADGGAGATDSANVGHAGAGSAAGRRDLRFRLPTGADQEAIGELARDDALGALDALLQRCVLDDASTLSPRQRAEVEQAMRAAAFGPQLSLDATCPECGRAFTLPFDIQDFFFGEVAATPDLLLREVHYLALHYHWAEGEILGMPRERRQRYLRILADELSRQTDALV